MPAPPGLIKLYLSAEAFVRDIKRQRAAKALSLPLLFNINITHSTI